MPATLKHTDSATQIPQATLDLINPKALVMLDGIHKTPDVAAQIKRLADAGWGIVGSEGTAKFLNSRGITTTVAEKITGYAPAMNHRMASSSWEINSGLISDQNNPSHDEYLRTQGIPKFQFLVCTVYGLDEEMRNTDSTWKSRLEKTDFGGPAALRAAAKGRRAIVFDISQLESTITRLLEGDVTSEWLEKMAAETEFFCTHYSGLSATNISDGNLQTIFLKKVRDLRRGENPCETGAKMMRNAFGHDDPLTLDKFDIVGDTEPGWVNWKDIGRSLNSLTTLAAVLDINGYINQFRYLGVVVKHGNPVGLAVAETAEEAIRLTLTGNQRAAFGGIAMFNFPIDQTLAKHILRSWLPEGKKYRYLAGVVAPHFTPGATEKLRGKMVKKQLLTNPSLASLDRHSLDTSPKYTFDRGVLLFSNGERYLLDLQDQLLTQHIGDKQVLSPLDLIVAWAACATSNSNTTSCAKGNQLIGNGVGQQDRIGSCELSMAQAGEQAQESTVVSDSFFPETDGPAMLINHGVTTIMATSGSRADDNVIELVGRHEHVNLILVPDTHGRIFLH